MQAKELALDTCELRIEYKHANYTKSHRRSSNKVLTHTQLHCHSHAVKDGGPYRKRYYKVTGCKILKL